MDKIAVSVIVPVFNGEKKLAECLGNLVNQTLQSIELILVNDASTDSTLQIMEACKQQYPEKVVVIDSEKNMGAGGARNLGLEVARGEYIGFVDSDDLVELSMYEQLYDEAIERELDIIDSGYYKEADDLAIVHTSDDMTGKLDIEKRNKLIVSGGYIVTKLFKRELFNDPELRFRNNVILEDMDFLIYSFMRAQSIDSIKKVMYYYRDNKSSTSNTDDLARYHYNICEAMKNTYAKVSGLGEYNKVQCAVEYTIIQLYSYGVNICARRYVNGEKADYMALLSQLQSIKQATVSLGYDNLYVQEKIGKLDIELMRLNDASPESLLNYLTARRE